MAKVGAEKGQQIPQGLVGHTYSHIQQMFFECQMYAKQFYLDYCNEHADKLSSSWGDINK